MFLNSKEGQNYYAGVLPTKKKIDTGSRGAMGMTRGSRSTKGATTNGTKGKRNSQDSSSGRSNSRDAAACNSKEKMPEDVMVILV